MKPVLHRIVLDSEESFTCKAWDFSARDMRCESKYHPDYLILLRLRGRGMRFIGDSVERFSDHDLVIIGPNLPHSLLSDPVPKKTRHISSTFSENFLGEKFMAMPEIAAINHLLSLARRGVAFPPSVHKQVAPDMIRMSQTKGGERLCLLLRILQRLATARGIRPLASEGFSLVLNELEATRLATVCRYIQQSYQGKIHRDTAAGLAGLSPSAFSRFFHRRMGRTFQTYVTEVRVGQACHKLLEEDSTIAQIAFETGFNNLSNFNQSFRQLKGMNPRDFRRLNLHTLPRSE